MTDNIEVFTQSSIRITDRAGTIYCDPFRLHGTPKDADYILITHDHYDHFSPEDIEKAATAHTVLVVPENMKGQAKDVAGLVGSVVTVRPGQSYQVGELSFETVTAYNNTKRFHPKSAGWVGYLLLLDGQRVYVAGDTDAIRENRSLSCDVAMIPIGGTYTMDVREAADLINAMRPSVAIPIHYGSIVGSKGDAQAFRKLVDDAIDVRIIMQY